MFVFEFLEELDQSKIMRKRRMPDEKLAEIISRVDFSTSSLIWLPKLEKCFQEVLKYEHYLNRIPNYLSAPKYRKIVVRIIYRLMSQVAPSELNFSKDIKHPDPAIIEFMHYLAEIEIQRLQQVLNRNPITTKSIQSLLKSLKLELEI